MTSYEWLLLALLLVSAALGWMGYDSLKHRKP